MNGQGQKRSFPHIFGNLLPSSRSFALALRGAGGAAPALFGQGLNGAGVCALKVNGSGGNDLLESELLTSTGAPGPELSFCAGVCWVGPQGTLAKLAEVLGV